MPSLPPFNERGFNLLVSYSISSSEQKSEAVVNAFAAADIDVFEKPTTLSDWLNIDVLEDTRWGSGDPYLGTEVWDHPVLITTEEIRIYTPTDERA